MRRRPKILRVMLVLAMILLGSASLAQASFWVKGMGFYYSPDYGDFGDGLEKVAGGYNTLSVLEAGPGTAVSVGYDFSGNWGIRLDTFSFSGLADYHHLTLPDTFLFKTSTSPILVSIVHRISAQGELHPYLGAGMGGFPSELTIISNVHEGAHYTDLPMGFQVFAGAEYRFGSGLFFSGELRYISAMAEYPGYRCLESCSTDWSGVLASIGFGCRF